jgi:hypothetical protein
MYQFQAFTNHVANRNQMLWLTFLIYFVMVPAYVPPHLLAPRRNTAEKSAAARQQAH